MRLTLAQLFSCEKHVTPCGHVFKRDVDYSSVQKESVQDNVIRGTFKVSLTLSGRSPEPTPTKPNDLLGCYSKPRLSNRPQMPPPSRHVGSGESYLFSSLLLNLGFEPVGASPARGRVLERVTGG